MEKGHRKAVPAVLKRLHGNPGKRRISTIEPEGVGDLWAAPPWFDDDQRAQWAYALEHSPPGLLTGTDRGALLAYVTSLVEYEKATRSVRELGQLVTTKEGVKLNPALRVMNAQAHTMMRAASELGFTPAARASLGNKAPEPLPHGNIPAARSRLQGYLDRKPDQLDG